MASAMTPVIPQELLDHIVDLSCDDRSTLLLLLKSARIFGERCRMYIYRVARVQALTSSEEFRQSCLTLYDLLTRHNTGRFVLTLHYRFSLSSRAVICSAMSDCALLMPNLQEVKLEGRWFVFHEHFDWSLLVPNPKSITRMSVSGRHCREGLAGLMRTCPSLGSLAFISAGVTQFAPSITVDNSHSETAAARAIGQLAFVDCDVAMMLLVSTCNRISWSGLRRLFVVHFDSNNYSDYYPIWKTLTFFQKNARLNFLYWASPSCHRALPTVVDIIIQIPHVVLQFRDMKSVKRWLRAIFIHAQKVPYRLLNLDVIYDFVRWDALMHCTDFYEEFYTQLMSLNERNVEKLRVRFITTGTPIRHPDNGRKESRQCTQPVQLVLTDTSSYRIHREFMESDISGSCYDLACPKNRIPPNEPFLDLSLDPVYLEHVRLEQRLSTLISQ